MSSKGGAEVVLALKGYPSPTCFLLSESKLGVPGGEQEEPLPSSPRSACLVRRREVDEIWLESKLATMTDARLAGLPHDAIGRLAQRARCEQRDLEAMAAGHRGAGGAAESRGRQTGSHAWRAARGELGGRDAGSGSSPVVRICGGAGAVVHGVSDCVTGWSYRSFRPLTRALFRYAWSWQMGDGRASSLRTTRARCL